MEQLKDPRKEAQAILDKAYIVCGKVNFNIDGKAMSKEDVLPKMKQIACLVIEFHINNLEGSTTYWRDVLWELSSNSNIQISMGI